MLENEFPVATCKNEEQQHSEEQQPTALGIASNRVMNVPKKEPSLMNISFVDEETELLDDLLPPIQSRKLFKLKDPVVVLERCDKIWETLELIKTLQNNASVDSEASSDREDGDEDNDDDHRSGGEDTIEGPPTPPVENPKTYIEYQPRLNNGNSALPNFIFSVKSTKPLYQCSKCGKQYSEQRALRRHSEKIHGIAMLRRKYSSKFKKSQDTASSDTGESSKSSGSSSSNSHSEECVYGERENGKLLKPVQSSKLGGALSSFDPSSSIDKTDKINSKVPPKSQDSKKPDSEHNVNMNYCCTLCQREFRQIRRHLTEYHKIKQPESVVLELIRQSVIPGRLKTANSSQTKTESVSSTSKTDESVDCDPKKRKRTSSSSSLDSYKKFKANHGSGQESGYNRLRCDLCLGVYSSLRCLSKHKLSHVRFKETKENIELWRNKYKNSPFRKLGQEQSPVSGKEGEEEQQTRRLTRSDSRKEDNDEEIACSCGRLFRNPHTLYVHKSVCKMTKEEEEAMASKGSPMNTSMDRDSGIGISITIKKKNDSYEIVSRDSSDEEKPKGSEEKENDDDDRERDRDEQEDQSSNASTGGSSALNNNTDELLAMESSKYSKDHSIMKLQFVEEDMDVDILNDAQETTPPPPESTSSRSSVDNHPAKPKSLQRVVKVKCNVCNKFFRSKAELKTHQDSEHKKKPRDSPKTCPCGVKTENSEEFRKHLKDQHILWLTCPYCKHACRDTTEYKRHRCHVICGKDVEECNSIYKCAICKAAFKSLAKLDQHCLEQHKDVAPFTCHWCPDRFTSIDERKVHMSEHLTALCEICYAKVEPNDKHRHKDYHFGLGFACHICKTAFAKKTNFVQHMCIRHNDDKTWKIKCLVCSQKHRVHTYYNHLDSHEESRICPLCPKRFQDSYNLKHHVNKLHPNYEVTNCEEYKLQFYNKWALKIHAYHSNCSSHNL